MPGLCMRYSIYLRQYSDVAICTVYKLGKGGPKTRPRLLVPDSAHLSFQSRCPLGLGKTDVFGLNQCLPGSFGFCLAQLMGRLSRQERGGQRGRGVYPSRRGPLGRLCPSSECNCPLEVVTSSSLSPSGLVSLGLGR